MTKGWNNSHMQLARILHVVVPFRKLKLCFCNTYTFAFGSPFSLYITKEATKS